MSEIIVFNKNTIAFYNNLKKDAEGTILKGLGNAYNDTLAKITYRNKKFEILLENKGRRIRKVNQFGSFKNVEVHTPENRVLCLKDFFIYSRSDKLKGTPEAISSKGFSDKTIGYHKVLIPVKKGFDFFFILESRFFNIDENKQTRLGTTIYLDNEVIEMYLDDDEEKNRFLVIQSRVKQAFRDFSWKVHIVAVALGYITGYYPGNECCFFICSHKSLDKISKFRFQTRQKEINSVLFPTSANPFGWLSINKRDAEYFYKHKLLKKVSVDIFSALCKKMLASEDFFSVILLIIESNSTNLLLRPIGFSVALEAITDIITNETPERYLPITDKTTSRTLRSDLSAVLDKYQGNEHVKDHKTLKGKIENINQMTNKEKLLAPFRALGINLDSTDEKIINSRNDFLHGRVPDYRELGKSRKIEVQDQDLYYGSLSLYTLLSILLLRYIGFNGYVFNYPKIYEKETGYKCNQKYFRKV
ncbi:hypothetical protein LQ567_16215 [Niabella pedocola]|uniref:ApeA N-terminal domain-containing protein n=1 Tax=Niabella pedocola TaxID=1752077 RepID=A0ABS8PTD1_9BACT|nr:hypothetical protein [Niabella pedocola]MCD2424325.1 hypothetical protein [Niabella pedocola]